jgi:hypothetical protein
MIFSFKSLKENVKLPAKMKRLSVSLLKFCSIFPHKIEEKSGYLQLRENNFELQYKNCALVLL